MGGRGFGIIGGGLGVMGGALMTIYPGFGWVVLLIGVGVVGYGALVVASDRRAAGGPAIVPQDLIFWGLIGATLCLAVAVGGYGWQRFGHAPAQVTAAPSGNPLWDQVVAYTTPHGKKAAPGPGLGERGANFTMGDSSNGDGPYITSWADELGPWPTTADGFTAYQLRIFPAKRPAFKNEPDRNKLSEAVNALSDVVDMKMRGIITQTENVAGVWPIVARGRGKGAVTVLDALQKIRTDSDEVNAALYTGNNTVFDKYPPYRDDLHGVIPDELKTYWDAYQVAFNDFANAMNLIRDVEPNSDEVYNRAVENAARFQKKFVWSASDLRDRITLTSGRIVWMKKAI